VHHCGALTNTAAVVFAAGRSLRKQARLRPSAGTRVR
jgi:hypothetical protein